MNKLIYNLAASLRAALIHIGEYKDGDGAAKYHVNEIGNEALGHFDAIRIASVGDRDGCLHQKWAILDSDLQVLFKDDGREETVFEIINFGRDTTIGYGATQEGSERIAACLNACSGISTRELKSNLFTDDPDAWTKRPIDAPFRLTAPATDPLTIAYIAIGVQNVLDHEGGLPDDLADRCGGQMGFINSIVSHASMLDEMARKAGGEHGLGVVFPYEIAQPFGEQMASAELEGTPEDPRALGSKLISRVTSAAA